jgi:hypothetical protein
MKVTNKNLYTFVNVSNKLKLMEAVTHLTLTFNQLADLALQLPKPDRLRLVSILQDGEEPSKEQVLHGLREAIEEVNLAKQGKIKLKSAREFISEL